MDDDDCFWHVRYWLRNSIQASHGIRLKSSGKLVFRLRAIFSMFTKDTFLTPRSTPL